MIHCTVHNNPINTNLHSLNCLLLSLHLYVTPEPLSFDENVNLVLFFLWLYLTRPVILVTEQASFTDQQHSVNK